MSLCSFVDVPCVLDPQLRDSNIASVSNVLCFI